MNRHLKESDEEWDDYLVTSGGRHLNELSIGKTSVEKKKVKGIGEKVA